MIVLLKPAAPVAAAAAGGSLLPAGLSLERPLDGTTAASRATSAAAATAKVSSAAQAGTPLLLTITDGASAAAKLRELRANPGRVLRTPALSTAPLWEAP